MIMYKIYRAPSFMHYSGIALVAADSANDANDHIKEFKEYDSKNEMDSYGIRFVDESDVVEALYSSHPGIILNEVTYVG